MFTIRAERHAPTGDGKSYQVLQAHLYEVEYEDGRAKVQYFSPDEFWLYIGPKEPFSVAYVMNDAGRTIDTIR